ncbi:MAG: sulfurtransferase complex subunit TusB [Pseudomonadales bacterium]
MPALHIVNQVAALADCLSVAGEDDSVLLIESAVYAAADPWQERPLFALAPDVQARGLHGRLGTAVTLVSDGAFVDLVAAHQPIVSWR